MQSIKLLKPLDASDSAMKQSQRNKFLVSSSHSVQQLQQIEPKKQTAQPTKKKSDAEKIVKWKKSTKMGSSIKGTNLIPVKTFLMNPKWDSYVDPTENFTLFDCLKHLKEKGIKVGAICDLNSSYDYYNFDEYKHLPEFKHLIYKKFPLCAEQIPQRQDLKKVHEFLYQLKDAPFHVLVHCFNGVNRTGFVLITYLCQKLNFSNEDAIKHFEEDRGHKIEHKNLIDEIKINY
eukprot:TRINITY_DN8451_c0_g1_i2.p1 TRINITY_DN8451_c0_g1~~TRINITY_DN8451_c0_g1_i2.p1  ORF type:complete len:232 (+),score=14.31 TRINITY_DN8451_c0_g1_i2:37-732(+)